MNMDHLKKYIPIKFSNTPKCIIECCICRKKEIENTCKNVSFLKGVNILQQISKNKLHIIPHYKILIYFHASHVFAMGR